MDNDQQYMRELYERFRNEISQGIQPDYYDRDELLDIYDYAQDEADVLTQMYVFLVAARLYNDVDSFLGERIGFFVSYLDSQAGADLLNRKGRPDTPLWDVLAIGVKQFPDGDPTEELNIFFKKHHSIDSESLIKLIDLLREMNRPDLIAAHIDDLRKCVDNLPGMLFEVAEFLRQTGTEEYIETARKLAEELTEKEPFNVDNWILLAKIQFRRRDVEEILSAVDYALALDPGLRAARVIRAAALTGEGRVNHELIDELRTLVAEDPYDAVAMRSIIEALRDIGKNEEAVDYSIKLIRLPSGKPVETFRLIFEIGPTEKQLEDLSLALPEFLGEEERKYLEFAQEMIQQGREDAAAFVLECYDRSFGLYNGAEMLIGLYYNLKRYKELVDYFLKCCNRNAKFSGKIKDDERDPADIAELLAGKDENELHEENKAPIATDEQKSVTDRTPLVADRLSEPMMFSTSACLFFAASALLIKDFPTAEFVANMVLATPDSRYKELNVYDKISIKGILYLMRRILNYAQNPETIPSDPDFDPISE